MFSYKGLVKSEYKIIMLLIKCFNLQLNKPEYVIKEEKVIIGRKRIGNQVENNNSVILHFMVYQQVVSKVYY